MFKSLGFRIQICWRSLQTLLEDGYTYRASALAFTTLLALVPLLSVVVSFISEFPVFTGLITLARNYIFTNFVPTSRNVIEYYLESCIRQATGLPAIGIIFLVVTTGILIMTIEHTFSKIWQAPDHKTKYKSWFLYWLILLLAPLLIGLSVFVSSYLLSLSWFSHTVHFLGLETPLLACIPVFINTLIFSLLYIVIPGYRVKWRDGVFGGFIAAILFEVTRTGFVFYIRQFHHYKHIYGALATIPIFLLWIYIVWLVILYGALVTHAPSQISYNRTGFGRGIRK